MSKSERRERERERDRERERERERREGQRGGREGVSKQEQERTKRKPDLHLFPVTFQLTPFVDCCVCLLDRPDLLPSPLSQGRLISVLLAFINSDKRQPQAG